MIAGQALNDAGIVPIVQPGEPQFVIRFPDNPIPSGTILVARFTANNNTGSSTVTTTMTPIYRDVNGDEITGGPTTPSSITVAGGVTVDTVDITIEKSANKSSVAPGEMTTIRYTVTVESTGNQQAKDVMIEEDIATGFPDNAEVIDKSSQCTVDANEMVMCDLGDLDAGQMVELFFVIELTPEEANLINNVIAKFLGIGDVEQERTSNTVTVRVSSGGSSGGGGCSLVTAGTMTAGVSVANALILFVPGILIGIRRLRKRNKIRE